MILAAVNGIDGSDPVTVTGLLSVIGVCIGIALALILMAGVLHWLCNRGHNA